MHKARQPQTIIQTEMTTNKRNTSILLTTTGMKEDSLQRKLAAHCNLSDIPWHRARSCMTRQPTESESELSIN